MRYHAGDARDGCGGVTAMEARGEPMSLAAQRTQAFDSTRGPRGLTTDAVQPEYGWDQSFRARRRGAHPSVLVIDDDESMRDTLRCALWTCGIDTVVARDGLEAMARARVQPFDLMIVDLRMPGLDGLDVVRRLRAEGVSAPFILLSAYLTTQATVDAMRLGAVDVVDKLTDIEQLLARIECRHEEDHPTADAGAPAPALAREARSVAERWADYVERGSASPSDLTTARAWARYVGVSETCLRECCRLVGVAPRGARDLMRVLRALRAWQAGHGEVARLLSVGDRRTRRHLLQRAGLNLHDPMPASVGEFLDRQRLVPPDHEGVRALRRRLAPSDHESGREP